LKKWKNHRNQFALSHKSRYTSKGCTDKLYRRSSIMKRRNTRQQPQRNALPAYIRTSLQIQ